VHLDAAQLAAELVLLPVALVVARDALLLDALLLYLLKLDAALESELADLLQLVAVGVLAALPWFVVDHFRIITNRNGSHLKQRKGSCTFELPSPNRRLDFLRIRTQPLRLTAVQTHPDQPLLLLNDY